MRVMKRRWKNADVYLFFNEGALESEHAVTLMSKGRIAQVWDPQTGRSLRCNPRTAAEILPCG